MSTIVGHVSFVKMVMVRTIAERDMRVEIMNFTECLEQERRRDTRCPICRFVVEGGTTSRIFSQEPAQFGLRRVENSQDSEGGPVLRLSRPEPVRDSHGNIIPFRLLPQHISDDPEHPILPFSLQHPQHYEF